MVTTGLHRRRGGGVAFILFGVLLLGLSSAANVRTAENKEKAAALSADLARIPTDSMMVGSSRVADLWQSDYFKGVREKYKKEIGEASEEFAGHFGLRLEQVERVTFVMIDPPPSREEPLLFVRTLKPYDQAAVLAAGKNVKAVKHKKETLHVGDKNWGVYLLDKQSLVFGAPDQLRALIDHPQPEKEGNLAGAIRLAAEKHSGFYAFNVQKFNDGVGNQLGEEAEPFRPLLKARSAVLIMDLKDESRLTARLTFAGEKDAKAAVKSAEKGLALIRMGLEVALKQVGNEKEMSATVKLLQQVREPLKALRVQQQGETLTGSISLKVEPATFGLALVEAVQKVRTAAARAQSQNNLRQIALAMHTHADALENRFPAHAIFDKNGKPLLSWRVAILPYLGEKELYEQFHLDEPWDSEHNKKLLAKMPRVYTHPQAEKANKEHATHYQGLVGPGAFFEGKRGLRLPADFPDGTSNTLMIVEASKAVPWTKPDDVPYDPSKPLPKLGLPGARGFLACLCDGSVRMISHAIREKTLRDVITRNDGNPIGDDF